MRDYVKGYKVPEQVILVKSAYNNQAFVVDPDSKSQLETAKNWARDYHWRDNSSKEGECISTENKDFEVEILEAAGNSSQGGKLSFWNCKVTKDGNSFVIGINQEFLLELIKSSTIVKGKVNEKCVFIKQKGNTGLVVEGSNLYNECMKDLELRNKRETAKKTTVWEPGYYYETLTKSDTYLMDVYIWYKEEEISHYNTRTVALDKPIKKKLALSDFCLDKQISKLSEFVSSYDKYKNLMYYHLYDKLPLRSKGGKAIDVDINIETLNKKKGEYIKYIRESEDINWKLYDIDKLILTTFDTNPPVITDYYSEILEKFGVIGI